MGRAPFTILNRSFLARRQRLNIWRVQQQTTMGQHRHEFFEIVVVVSGKGTHVTGNYQHRLETGDVVILNPRRAHGYDNCVGLNIINILVRDDTLQRIGRSLGELPGYRALFRLESILWKKHEYSSHLRLNPAELKRIEEWVERIEEETSRGARAVNLLQEACLALIIDLLCRLYTRQHGHSTSRHSHSSGNAAHLNALLSWIQKHLDRPLRVSTLAEQAGMSERTFHRAFHSALQLTPQTYIAEARMHRATEMLSDAGNTLSITEIGLACGFNDSNYFTRCFHRHAGISPRLYRKKHCGTHSLR